MTLTDEPLHPVTVVFIVLAFFMALLARITVTHGVLAAAGVLFVTVLAGLIAFGVYEMWTMPPDDDRWDIVAESQRIERDRERFQ